ncbi:MAG: macro domain-containing protein [Bacilli bacterium]|nr:macro domain-containing protein [Bacilli bacterium]MBQ6538677.1 macro domain-containing protein [Bacilli bacterium]
MIKLIHGSAADQEVEVVVNAANKYLKPGGGVCGQIFSQAGYFELDEACKKINTPLSDGDVVMTPSFNMTNCKYIFHAVGPDFSVSTNVGDLYNAYYNSLLLLKENHLHSISFPLISSGIFGGNLSNPARNSATQCLKAYNDFINDSDYSVEVILCAFSEKEYVEASQVF